MLRFYLHFSILPLAATKLAIFIGGQDYVTLSKPGKLFGVQKVTLQDRASKVLSVISTLPLGQKPRDFEKLLRIVEISEFDYGLKRFTHG